MVRNAGGSGAASKVGVIAGLMVVFALLGAVAFVALRPSVEVSSPAGVTPAVEETAAVPGPVDVADTEPSVVTDNTTDPAGADDAVAQATPPAPDTAPTPPTFDVVRVAANGTALVAGRAAPGAEITILLDGVDLTVAEADATGAFVAILRLDPADTPRALTLRAAPPDPDGAAVAGVETVLVAPFGPLDEGSDPASEVIVAVGPEEDPTEGATQDGLAAPTGAPSPDEMDAAVAQAEAADTDPSTPDTTGDIAIAALSPDAGDDGDTSASAIPDAPNDDPEGAEVPPGPVASTDGTADAPGPVVADPGEDAADGPTTDVETTTATRTPDPAAPPTSTPVASDAPDAPTPPEPPVEAPEAQIALGQTPDRAPAPPTILLADEDGVRVLQGAAPQPQAQTEVLLDTIAYDTDGAVILSGRGAADAQVRVLLDDQPIRLGAVGPGGAWRLDLPDVVPGTYTLRVEQLDQDGTVTARVETPFLREDPARIATSPMRVADGISVITVQPGFTLWGIAETNFGDGVLYVSIFEENRGQIRNPDLIFPGQIFDLPDLPRTPATP